MYSVDRRVLASHVYALFQSLRKTSIILQTSHSTIWRWLKNPNKNIYSRTVATKTELVIETIKIAIQSNPFVTLKDLTEIIFQTFKFKVSKELVRRAIHGSGLSRKKAKLVSRPKHLMEQTTLFIETRNRHIANGKTFFSLDETSFGRNTKRVYGYAPKGEKIIVPRSFVRRTTCSSIVVISKSEIVKRIEHIGAINTQLFYNFLVDIEFPSNAVLLLDNVRFHHSKIIKEYAELIGLTLLYTPPYSPWFNPIEGVFSIVKRKYYLHGNINDSFASVEEKHCTAFFNKSLLQKFDTI